MNTELYYDDYKKIRSNRQSDLILWQVIPDWIWVIIVILGCMFLLKEHSPWWLKLIGLISIIYSSAQLGSRIWRVTDFMEGYRHGFSDGVITKAKFKSENELREKKKED